MRSNVYTSHRAGAVAINMYCSESLLAVSLTTPQCGRPHPIDHSRDGDIKASWVAIFAEGSLGHKQFIPAVEQQHI